MGRAWRGASLLLIAAHGNCNGNGNGAMGQRRRQLQLQWHWGRSNRSNGNGNGARGMGQRHYDHCRSIVWVWGAWGTGVGDVYSVVLFKKVSEWQKEVRIKE
jgi:hypothetical protein